MLGDFEAEAFDRGRGSAVRDNAVSAIATLCGVMGLDPPGLRLHRDDPLTTHACPGANVRKLDFIQRVQDVLLGRHRGEHGDASPTPAVPVSRGGRSSHGSGRRRDRPRSRRCVYLNRSWSL
jgi:hypothetical protein